VSDSVDYVVVGAGTAGCVLANRLSANPHIRVALLELGGMDSNPAIYDRSIDSMYSLWEPQGAENWGYTTVPQPGLNGRAIDVARGKVIGGSSAVNAMIHVRGNRRDFDAWAQLGNHLPRTHVAVPRGQRTTLGHRLPKPLAGVARIR
jgi:choline dehydrogenase